MDKTKCCIDSVISGLIIDYLHTHVLFFLLICRLCAFILVSCRNFVCLFFWFFFFLLFETCVGSRDRDLQQQLWDLGRTPVNTIALKKNLIGY